MKNTKELAITHLFNAPREKVFEAWTKGEILSNGMHLMAAASNSKSSM